jgi:molybdopterin synthase sulfur carrier subunit
MSIKIRLFASLAESLQRREATLEFIDGMTVGSAWLMISGDTPAPDGILTAVNMSYCESDTALQDGDEVAYFPPMTGG